MTGLGEAEVEAAAIGWLGELGWSGARRYGYPPDKQEKATTTVLEQAEALSAVWAEAA